MEYADLEKQLHPDDPDAPLCVVGWVAADSVPAGTPHVGGMGGFIEHGDRWKDFIDAWDGDAKPYMEALREDIVQRGIRRDGIWHQNDPAGAPVFSDGTVGEFTMRCWGDLMAAVWAEHDDRDYCYMDFYMSDAPDRTVPRRE